ncbi:hypothetical protein HC766_06180 [Candidatus Gracilibacteria bacterium]|nr:hypothetical protein [Candidatus Gracilibacteria bacterium]
MVFLMTVSFVPFSSHLLGSYPETNFAISFYAVNIIIIGTTLYILRQYLLNRPYLLQDSIDSKDIIHGTVRIFLPPVFAAIAVVVSYFNIPMSYILLTFPFVFNILPGGLNYLEYKLIHRPRIFINPMIILKFIDQKLQIANTGYSARIPRSLQKLIFFLRIYLLFFIRPVS